MFVPGQKVPKKFKKLCLLPLGLSIIGATVTFGCWYLYDYQTAVHLLANTNEDLTWFGFFARDINGPLVLPGIMIRIRIWGEEQGL